MKPKEVTREQLRLPSNFVFEIGDIFGYRNDSGRIDLFGLGEGWFGFNLDEPSAKATAESLTPKVKK